MIKAVPQLTYAGESLLMRAVSGEKITFTRFKAGDAKQRDSSIYDGSDFEVLTDIINTKLTFDITGIDTSEQGVAQISGAFSTANIGSEFVWRELGVFAKGEDNIELLYAYAYDSSPSYIEPYSADIALYQKLTFAVAIGEAENVTAQVTVNQPMAGGYAGDGLGAREIVLGFKPRAVMLTDEFGRTFAADGVYGGIATRGHGVRGLGSDSAADGEEWSSGETALLITDTGFKVGAVANETAANSICTNLSGVYYNYVAIS